MMMMMIAHFLFTSIHSGPAKRLSVVNTQGIERRQVANQ